MFPDQRGDSPGIIQSLRRRSEEWGRKAPEVFFRGGLEGGKSRERVPGNEEKAAPGGREALPPFAVIFGGGKTGGGTLRGVEPPGLKGEGWTRGGGCLVCQGLRTATSAQGP